MSKMLKASEQVLSPVDLAKTMGDLTLYQQQFTDLRQRVQQASDQKGSLLRSKFTLETEISLAESDAIMAIQGDGKDAHVILDGVRIPMTNDTARKAYMQSVAQRERSILADVEGHIAQIDADRFRLNDEISILQQEMSAAQSKANLQANLLQFMASEVTHVNQVTVETPTLEVKHVVSNAYDQARLEELLEAEATLSALEAVGVDNWGGYSEAMKMVKGTEGDDE